MTYPTEDMLEEIDEFGWGLPGLGRVTASPTFCYTCRLTSQFGEPELVMVGIPPSQAGAILNEMGTRIVEWLHLPHARAVKNLHAPQPASIAVPSDLRDRQDVILGSQFCDHRLKPPPSAGQYSAAVQVSNPASPTATRVVATSPAP